MKFEVDGVEYDSEGVPSYQRGFFSVKDEETSIALGDEPTEGGLVFMDQPIRVGALSTHELLKVLS